MRAALRRLGLRLLAAFRHRAADADVRDELVSHLALAAEEYEQRGASPGEARRRAARDLGGIEAAREGHRDARGVPALDALRQDVAYALRGFRRETGFTAVAVLILAIGIGANTAVFSVVNPLVLRPLPFPDADRLVWIADTRGAGLSDVTYPVDVYEALARHATSFDEVTAYFAFFGYGSYALTGAGRAERVSAVNVGPRFFETLGVRPALGRAFTREELAPNGRKAVLLSHALWQRRWAADPSLVGRAIAIDGQAYAVVGVLPAGFDFASVFAPGQRAEMFLPAVLDDMRGWGNTLAVIGRLKPGVSLTRARAEIGQLMPRLNEANPGWGTRNARLSALKDRVGGPVRRSLVVLWSAVGLVILIVCANLSNLLLARTAGRSKEMALRMTLGASRGRIVRQLLTEGVVLALAGAALGVALAIALTSWLRSTPTLSLPLLSTVTVDGTALLFTATLAILVGLTFGLLPALRVSKRNPQDALKERGRGSTDSRRHAWVRDVMVVTEIAVACVLLVGAGLLLRSFYQLQHAELGFEPAHVSAVRVDADATLAREQRRALLDELSRQLAELPGVEAVGLTDALPLDRNRSWNLSALGRERRAGENVAPFVYVVGPGYFDSMGIPIKAGRDFSRDDTAQRPRVVVINETCARLLWPGESPIGRLAMTGDARVEVIGVVADVRQTSLEEASGAQMYVGDQQFGAAGSELVVRSRLPADVLGPAIHARIAAVDAALVPSELRPIGDLVERAISPRRFLLQLLGGFAAIALLLACLGIYGVVSYAVSRRAQEMAVRMALGATAADVGGLVLAGTLRLTAIGLGLGLAASLVLARLIASLLYSTSPTDAATFAGTAVVLLAVAAAAGAVPARRAARTHPTWALRAD